MDATTTNCIELLNLTPTMGLFFLSFFDIWTVDFLRNLLVLGHLPVEIAPPMVWSMYQGNAAIVYPNGAASDLQVFSLHSAVIEAKHE